MGTGIPDYCAILRYLPVAKVAWQDIKGTQVLVGNYEESVKMMGDTNFLNALINFPKEAITDETVELLMPYFKAQDFNFESAKKVVLPHRLSKLPVSNMTHRLSAALTPPPIGSADCRDMHRAPYHKPRPQ